MIARSVSRDRKIGATKRHNNTKNKNECNKKYQQFFKTDLQFIGKYIPNIKQPAQQTKKNNEQQDKSVQFSEYGYIVYNND
jgi:hypothetical protein